MSAAATPDADRIRHDFKNQLAIVRGFAEILIGETAPDAPSRRDLEEIHRAATNALALLERLFPETAAEVGPDRG